MAPIILPPPFPFLSAPDERGLEHGPRYKPTLRAGWDSHASKDAIWHSPKVGRAVHCLGKGAYGISMLLTVDPFVLDFREEYPWVEIELLEAIHANPNIDVQWRDIPTMDFVVTMQTSQPDKFRDVIVSHKMDNHQSREAVQQRLLWEQDQANAMGWGYRVFSRRERWEYEIATAFYLLSLIEGLSLNHCHEAAREVAKLVKQKSQVQPLDRLLNCVSKNIPCDLDFCYTMFAAAVCLGFLSIDLTARCGPLWPLRLIAAE